MAQKGKSGKHKERDEERDEKSKKKKKKKKLGMASKAKEEAEKAQFRLKHDEDDDDDDDDDDNGCDNGVGGKGQGMRRQESFQKTAKVWREKEDEALAATLGEHYWHEKKTWNQSSSRTTRRDRKVALERHRTEEDLLLEQRRKQVGPTALICWGAGRRRRWDVCGPEIAHVLLRTHCFWLYHCAGRRR